MSRLPEQTLMNLQALEAWKETIADLVDNVESILRYYKRNRRFEDEFPCDETLDQLTRSAMFVIDMAGGNSAPLAVLTSRIDAVYRASLADELEKSPGFDDEIRPILNQAMIAYQVAKHNFTNGGRKSPDNIPGPDFRHVRWHAALSKKTLLACQPF